MIGLVLAAGPPSEELRPLVPPRGNKVLLHVLGRPILYHVLSAVSRRCNRTLVVYREGEELVAEEASRIAPSAVPVKQRAGNTVRDAVLAAAGLVDREAYFLLAFGDLVIPEDAVAELLSAHYEEEPDATILAVPVEPYHVETYGIVEVDEGWRARRVEPRGTVGGAFYALGGIYVLPNSVLDLLERGANLPEAIGRLASEGRVRAVPWNRMWVDVGYPTDIIEASYQLLSALDGSSISSRAEVKPTAVIEGPVIVEEGAVVDHYAVIKGPAYVGRGAFVGAHSLVRDHADLGPSTKVGAFAEVKRSNLQPGASVGSGAVVLDSVLGGNSELGAGTVTVNVPVEEVVPRLRERIAGRPPRVERKMGAVVPYGARIRPLSVIGPGAVAKS
ncbi:MAG: sugar phosphate nucleotidyltransferase [Desulfurococcaceae archaeon]